VDVESSARGDLGEVRAAVGGEDQDGAGAVRSPADLDRAAQRRDVRSETTAHVTVPVASRQGHPAGDAGARGGGNVPRDGLPGGEHERRLGLPASRGREEQPQSRPAPAGTNGKVERGVGRGPRVRLDDDLAAPKAQAPSGRRGAVHDVAHPRA
jgi:hypothetical protein